MPPLILSGPALLPGGEIVADATIIVQDGRIIEVSEERTANADIHTDGVIAPGYIDLQLNGGFGLDFTADPTSIPTVARKLPATGVTAFLPTRITSEIDTYVPWLRAVEELLDAGKSAQAESAQVLGIHLEGVYFSPQRTGAHNPDLMRPFDLDEILTCYAASPLVRIVTLAPELAGAPEVIRALRARGIVVSAGHTNATHAQALAGLEAGIGWGTHLFNAMPGPTSREPWIPTALLLSDVPIGMIVDGVHLHPAIVKMVYRLKGAQGIILVTDAMAAMGAGPGEYNLGGYRTIVDERCARLESGSLAGSILTMDAAVRFLIEQSGCTIGEALTMASTTPADLLGLTHKGRLAVGADADLVVLDADLNVQHTLIGGRIWQPQVDVNRADAHKEDTK